MKFILTILLFMSLQNDNIINIQNIPNIIFEGEFTKGRGPCEVLPDGSRRWTVTKGFTITKIIEGKVDLTYVEVNLYNQKNDPEKELTVGKNYKVSLNLSATQLEKIANNKTAYHPKNAIAYPHIIAIESLD